MKSGTLAIVYGLVSAISWSAVQAMPIASGYELSVFARALVEDAAPLAVEQTDTKTSAALAPLGVTATANDTGTVGGIAGTATADATGQASWTDAAHGSVSFLSSWQVTTLNNGAVGANNYLLYEFTADADGLLEVGYDINVTGSGYLKMFGMNGGYRILLFDSSSKLVDAAYIPIDPWGGTCPNCVLADSASAMGTFSESLVSGTSYRLRIDSGVGFAGFGSTSAASMAAAFDISISGASAPVPEPSLLLLVGLAMASIVAVHRSRIGNG